jgi:hypothetical protein
MKYLEFTKYLMYNKQAIYYAEQENMGLQYRVRDTII